MGEKKLTDEKLLKELQEDVEIYKQDFRMFGDYFDIGRLERAIDLIHRQKAEIERLTRRESNLKNDKTHWISKTEEFQKRVDELTKKCSEIYWFKQYERAVKDTAKEILEELEKAKHYAKNAGKIAEKIATDIAIKTIKEIVKSKDIEVEE